MKSKISIVLPIVLALILPGLSLFTNSGLLSQDNVGFYQSWIMASFISYLLWYFLWYLWDIKSLYNNWWYIVRLLVLAGIMITALLLFTYKSGENLEWPALVARIIIGSIVFLTIQYALKAQHNISRLMIEKEQIQTENYKAQLKTLRSQIDPHFLFNSLNTLRTMVRHQDSNSEKFIMSLSDFYRQTLKHTENTTLKLSEELAVLQSYLFLMKSRNEEALTVDLSIDESFHQHHLPTLALQVVVENCFKHNSMSSKMPLHIEIKSTEDFYVEVTNNIQPKIGDNDSSGFGLELLKKRYSLMNIKQGIIVLKTPDRFCVKLKLI